ncbi:MAG: Hsp20/alpha crystallin family protein [Caulobacteraceae bacterium]
MPTRDPNEWMWGDALDVLARAERLHRQLFQPSPGPARQASWEPPVDILETDSQVLIIAALPGVNEGAIQLVIEGPVLVIAGERTVPAELRTAVIHRLELPQGRFERRVPLPAGRYDHIHRQSVNGCLVVTLRKVA